MRRFVGVACAALIMIVGLAASRASASTSPSASSLWRETPIEGQLHALSAVADPFDGVWYVVAAQSCDCTAWRLRHAADDGHVIVDLDLGSNVVYAGSLVVNSSFVLLGISDSAGHGSWVRISRDGHSSTVVSQPAFVASASGLFPGRNNDAWLATADGLVHLFDTPTGELAFQPFGVRRYHSTSVLTEAPDGSLWLMDTGLLRHVA